MKASVILLMAAFIIPLNVFSQLNQTDANGLRQGRWQKSYPNGRLMYEGFFKNDKPAGEWTRYYENGQIKAIIGYDQKSDTAYSVLFDQVGKKIAEGAYINEQRVGKWEFFSDKRKISEEVYANGLKHGISRTFYPTGEVLEEIEWKNGQQEGSYRVFFKNGNPYMQCKLSMGKRNGLCLSYFQNGRVEMEARYLDNLRHDEWNFYNENGNLQYTLKYDQGNLLNPEVQDSIEALNQNQFEKKFNPGADPENFMRDPGQFMMQLQKGR